MAGLPYRGTAAGQDFRFADKEAKQIKAISATAPKEYETKVYMSRVSKPVINAWINKRVTELLGVDDEIIPAMIIAKLEESESPNPSALQLHLTGFLAKDAATFVQELWGLLASAQEHPEGVPKQLLEAKRREMAARQAPRHHDKDHRERDDRRGRDDHTRRDDRRDRGDHREHGHRDDRDRDGGRDRGERRDDRRRRHRRSRSASRGRRSISRERRDKEDRRDRAKDDGHRRASSKHSHSPRRRDDDGDDRHHRKHHHRRRDSSSRSRSRARDRDSRSRSRSRSRDRKRRRHTSRSESRHRRRSTSRDKDRRGARRDEEDLMADERRGTSAHDEVREEDINKELALKQAALAKLKQREHA